MSAEFNPLKERERHIIGPGTEILGGKLLARAAFVVDTEENPEVYNTVLRTIDDSLAVLDKLGVAVASKTILKATHMTVRRVVPFHPRGYKKILKEEATQRGVSRLTPDHEVALSRFIGLAGTCHHHSLLSGTMLQMMQDRGDIDPSAGIEIVEPQRSPDAPLDQPSRHTKVVFSEGDQRYSIDTDTGVARMPQS